jgi:predicted dehydrogenase
MKSSDRLTSHSESPLTPSSGSLDITRRKFLAGAGATALGLTFLRPELLGAAEANSKIDIGIVGCGGRGAWIADCFVKHGNFNVVAIADYFPDRADGLGDKLKIPAAKRFTGLSGYKRLLEEKLDAVAIETPPYFHPEQAAAAVAAGKHVYLAKPVAVDVPGCQAIAESGRKATQKRLAFLVDFQTRAMPAYQEIVARVHKGDIGKLVSISAEYQTSLYFEKLDAEVRKDPDSSEVRLRSWAIDRVLSGDVILEQNIHALDVASWFANADPIKAVGHGGRARPFIGDCWDHYSVLFYYPGDLVVNFSAKQVGFGYDDIMARAYGMSGTASTSYGNRSWLRSRDDVFEGKTDGIYLTGVQNNILAFYESITRGDFSNSTVAPSVRSSLTAILGRTAAYQRTEVTWDHILRAKDKWHFDPKGLKG